MKLLLFPDSDSLLLELTQAKGPTSIRKVAPNAWGTYDASGSLVTLEAFEVFSTPEGLIAEMIEEANCDFCQGSMVD